MKSSISRLFGFGEKSDQDVLENADEMIMEELETPKGEIHQLDIQKIVPNRFQPRTIFDEEKIEELAATIKIHGVIQPIVVREMENGGFEVIAGERRLRAMKKLGWTEVPAIINNLTDAQTASVALIENLQREELTPIEEALAYGKLLQIHQLTQEALAQKLGKGQSTVANKLRLLKLPQQIQDSLLKKEITERHARALIPLKNEELQVKLLSEIIERNLNVKQTEDRVVKLLEEGNAKPKPKRKAFSKDVRIAVNTIRQSVTMCEDSGIKLDSKEEEFEDFYQITIKIPKKK